MSTKFPLAVDYARRHLCHWSSREPETLQRAMAYLALSSDLCRGDYAEFYPQHISTGNIFFTQNCSYNYLPGECKLIVHVRAGLSSLQFTKRNLNCVDIVSDGDNPFQLAAFVHVSSSVPAAKYTRSKLVCHVTGQRIDEDNPPLAMPSGFFYSALAMDVLADSYAISCPKISRGTFPLSDLKRVYAV